MEESRSCVRPDTSTTKHFYITDGLKQGKALSPVIFNIALDKAVMEARTRRQMLSIDGPRLLLAFAHDIYIFGQNTASVKFYKLQGKTRKKGLCTNEEKPKYMYVIRQWKSNFERVNSFKYLGTTITGDIDIQEEVSSKFLTIINV